MWFLTSSIVILASGLKCPLRNPQVFYSLCRFLTHLGKVSQWISLHNSQRNSAIIVFVDRLTKMVRLVPAATSVGTKDFAHAFIREVYSKHGMPVSIVSDWDPRITSEFFRDFCRHLQIELHMSTAFHPESDGQTECMNKYAEAIVRAFVNPSQDNWDLCLPLVELNSNNAYQSSNKTTPFFLNYSRHHHTPAGVSVPMRGHSSPLTQAEQLHRSLDLAKACLKQAQHYMAHYVNSKRRDLSFQVGEFVLLNSKNLQLKYEGVKKLAHRYFGPFEIVCKVGSRAYELNIPSSMKVHYVFHVSLLKLYRHKDSAITVPPPALLPSGGVEFEVESICAHKSEVEKLHLLLRWKGDDTDKWLEGSELSNCRDLLKAYGDTHGVKLSLSKRQTLKTFKKRGRKHRKV